MVFFEHLGNIVAESGIPLLCLESVTQSLPSVVENRQSPSRRRHGPTYYRLRDTVQPQTW
jgi:hypothetical protein